MKKIILTLFAAVFFIAAFSQVDLTTGLIAYYSLDGHADDSTSNQLDGFMHGPTSTTDRFNKTGKALHFNGTDQYINVPHDTKLSLTGNRTISAWYKLDDANMLPYQTIIIKPGEQSSGSHPNYQIYFRDEMNYNPRYRVSLLQGMGTTNKEIYTTQDYRNNLNTWVHIVASYNTSDSYFRIYFNGTISDSLYAPSFTPNTSTDSLQIGRGNKFNYSQSYFKGSLDDIRIYNRALNDAEVMALANEYHVYAGINSNTEAKTFNVYPNPFTQEVNIVTAENLANETSYRVYDVTGKVIVETSPVKANSISLNNLLPGTYVLELIHGSYSEYHKLIKVSE